MYGKKFLTQNNLRVFNSEFDEIEIEEMFEQINFFSKDNELAIDYIISKNINLK